MQKDNLKRELGFPDDNIARRLNPVMMNGICDLPVEMPQNKAKKYAKKNFKKLFEKTLHFLNYFAY